MADSTLPEHLVILLDQAGALDIAPAEQPHVLASGRHSPYKLQFKHVTRGEHCDQLAHLYAQALANSNFPKENVVLVGPPDTGTLLAYATASALARLDPPIHAEWASWYKAAKNEAWKGADVAGRNCIIIDDVISSGGSVRDAQSRINAQGGQLAGVLAGVDRMEPADPDKSEQAATDALHEDGFAIKSIAKITDFIAYLRNQGRENDAQLVEDYIESFNTLTP